jgi:hypothetical protein
MSFGMKWNNNVVPAELRAATLPLLESHLPCYLSNGWIAGGAIRSGLEGNKISDFDCYFTDVNSLLQTMSALVGDPFFQAKIIINDEHLISLNTKIGKIDLVKKYYTSPLACISEFDFYCCAFALSFNQSLSWFEAGLTDVKNRKLTILKPTCALSSTLRMQKFIKKGYTMDVSELKKLLDLTNKNTMNETLTKLQNRGHLYRNNIEEV